jgi:hypothetical protein
MRINDAIRIKCLNCEHLIEVKPDIECISTDERNMGTEYVYEGIYDELCPVCNNDLFLKIEAWEYPKLVLNYQNIETNNIEILGNIDFIFEEI